MSMASEANHDNNNMEHKDNTIDASKTSIHVMALDEVVSANSLFTAAVFVGLSLTSPSQMTNNNSLSSCNAGPDLIRSVIVFEVISFSCFLFSTIIAQGLKLGINLINSNDRHEAFKAKLNSSILKMGLMGCAIGSILGSVFLLLSMVFVIQIKLGLVSCGGQATVRAMTTLVVLVGSSLVLYVWTIFYTLKH